ncbi:radical SAM domain protein, partial [Bordetella holmesii H620]
MSKVLCFCTVHP